MNIFELTRILEANEADKLKNKIVVNVSKIPSENSDMLPKLNQLEKLTSFYASSAKSRKNLIRNRLLKTGFFNENDAWLEKFISNLTTEDVNVLYRKPFKTIDELKSLPLTKGILDLRDYYTKENNSTLSVGKYEILFAYFLGGVKNNNSNGDVFVKGNVYEIKTKMGSIGYVTDVVNHFDPTNKIELQKRNLIEREIKRKGITKILYFETTGNQIMPYLFDVSSDEGIKNFYNSCNFRIESAYRKHEKRIKIVSVK